MGVPSSEIGYTSATTGRGTPKSIRDMWLHWKYIYIYIYIYIHKPNITQKVTWLGIELIVTFLLCRQRNSVKKPFETINSKVCTSLKKIVFNVRYMKEITEQRHTAPYSFCSIANNKSPIRHHIECVIQNISLKPRLE
jgi:hypothetical protein